MLMLCSLFGSMAFAQDSTGETEETYTQPEQSTDVAYYPLWVAGEQVTSANAAQSDGKAWWYDAEANALHLTGDVFAAADKLHESAAIYYEKDDALKIIADQETNIAVFSENPDKVIGIYSLGSLEVQGKLTVSTGNALYQTFGIFAAKQITIAENAELTVTAGDTTWSADGNSETQPELIMASYGIYCDGDNCLTAIAGKLSATAEGTNGIGAASPIIMAGEAELIAYGSFRGLSSAPQYYGYTAYETVGTAPDEAIANAGAAVTDFNYVSIVPAAAENVVTSEPEETVEEVEGSEITNETDETYLPAEEITQETEITQDYPAATDNTTITETTIQSEITEDETPMLFTAVTQESTAPTTGISLGSDFSLTVGNTATITPAFTPADTTDTAVTWYTSDSTVAAVENGTVTAVKEGQATISAVLTSNPSNVQGQVIVTVNAAPLPTISLGDAFSLTVGESKTLSPVISNTTETALEWHSDKPEYASVDENGTVTANSAGSATITAALKSDSSVQAWVMVTVNAAPTTKISIGNDVSLTVGETKKLSVSTTPSDAIDRSVEWSSSDEAIVYVDTAGNLTALGAGEAVITAKLKSDNNVQDSLTVTVSSAVIKTTGIDIGGNFSLAVGAEKTLKATYSPSNATDKDLTWTTTNSSIATVDENGTVKGIADGTAIITAKLKSDNSVQDYVTVSVSTSHVTGISLDKTSITLAEGESTTLTYSVTPYEASDGRAQVTAGNAAIASISTTSPSSKTITVTGVAAGTTTITFKSVDGGYTAVCQVTVTTKEYVSGVAITDATGTAVSSITLTSKGSTKSVYAIVLPTTASNRSVEWATSDNNIAYITNATNTSCVINAYGNGTATITATTTDGSGKYAAINVVVNDATSTYKYTYKDNSGVWYYDSTSYSGFTVRCDGPASLLQGVLLDGYVLSSSYYTVAEGSTYITFPYSFMATLSHGRHTLSLIYPSCQVSTYIWSRSLYDPPITGDTDMTGYIAAMSVSALMAASCTVILKKKKED